MTAAELVHMELKRMHEALDGSLKGLTPEQRHQIVQPQANSIAWVVWHVVRTEDGIVRWIAQNRRPPVWTEGGYAEKLGLPPVTQGTGMATAEAHALRISDVDLWGEYMGKVWASTDELLARPDRDIVLGKTIMVRPLGEMPGVVALGTVCLTHGMTHFGEIELARTLVGAASAAGV